MPLPSPRRQLAGLPLNLANLTRSCRARSNAAAFAATLGVLTLVELSGSLAREFPGLLSDKVPHPFAAELVYITPELFKVPGDLPPPPPPPVDAPQVAAGQKASLSQPVSGSVAPSLLPRSIRAPHAASRAKRRNIFGALEFKTLSAGKHWPWERALQRMDNELPLYHFCETKALSCSERFHKWRDMLSGLKKLNGKALLAAVNSRVNALVGHSSDAQVFGAQDHWASPMEFLAAGGDCEDFTLLKYASLLELGIDEADLRIVVVKDMRRKRGHAVLAVNTPSGEWILDSADDVVRQDRAIRHYKPMYSLNRHQRWLHLGFRRIAKS